VTRWNEIAGDGAGEDYAARFEKLAASGKDLHGEARFVATAAGRIQVGSTRPVTVLDAGCGTGRVMIRLAELGFDCIGVDVDESMLAVARRTAPHLDWRLGDLAALVVPDAHSSDPDRPRTFDIIVMAGNIIPLLAPGTLAATVGRLAAHLSPGGLLLAGFGLDKAHLPPKCPVTPLDDYDAACLASGLVLDERFATWDRDPFRSAAEDGYAVSVHRHAD
jgi:SAM-dependent methyltransferase